jgi:hypothetical protein
MKYYSDPEELAVEFLENMTRGRTELQINGMINNLKALIDRNFTVIKGELCLEKERDFGNITERLRNTSLIIAIMKQRYGSDKNILKAKLVEIGGLMFPVRKRINYA